uniref:Uncharacterized protein n=1 Tax=Panagrolaimus sp. ES5 TaxID=591445 RepID=A0AC34G054_9BILA
MQSEIILFFFIISFFVAFLEGCLPTPQVQVGPTITTTTEAFMCPCTIPIVGATIMQTPLTVDGNGCPLTVQLDCPLNNNVLLNMDQFGMSYSAITCVPASGRFGYPNGLGGPDILINSIDCVAVG